ncbi:MAG TPA: NAD(P)H-dependent oxidoreductase subunit E [Chitinophagales bacterium]|nr:NAD(P)H-dependent oxidoreductase subunit E [Chitinophagales bacterium]HMZ34515.1 NAD(P)H-dependent oxidoreductase subunit E [Chitinophagales bacterium]HNB48217.1 NAD(P)H-dependent oxidoreductase subunit E [Chitinophagales bacterium]HNC72991.1 NAD(P)H-dependent oxidoreductase subunit E [Chitinophagales bacterium]HNF19648.1 NAD(P)H-dependent oxidoreductase subunit E [Chitinophagales bacterium]
MTTSEIKFNDEAQKKVQEILAQYPNDKSKSALLPLLHLAQAEFDGWLSPETMDYIASILNIQAIEVYEVATFYSMFNLKPVANYLIEICQTSSCWMCGAEDIVRYLEKKLNVTVGEPTQDGMFQIKTVECLGSCGTAPMFQIGDKYYENLTFEKIDALLEDLRKENKRSRYV